MPTKKPYNRIMWRQYQTGVNLIEIMVAMTIGLFLVLGATTLYVNSQQTSDVDDQIARLNETARYAMSIIESDVRMANYWGLSNDNTSIVNSDTASGTLANTSSCPNYYFATKVDKYLEVSNNSRYIRVYSSSSSSSSSSSTCTIKSTASAASDILTVRRASTSTPSLPTTTDALKLQLCANRTASTIINRSTPSCNRSGAEVHDLIANTYFIDTTSDQSQSIPSLRRVSLERGLSLANGPRFVETEVIPGIEDMQIELGWDNGNSWGDSLGAVQYVTPENLPSGGRIVAVRIWLMARTEKKDFSFTDNRTYSYAGRLNYIPINNGTQNYRRLLVSKTIFIRNAAGLGL